MKEHAVIEVHDSSVTCSCGEVFIATSLEKARRDHAYHFGIERSRAALRGEKV